MSDLNLTFEDHSHKCDTFNSGSSYVTFYQCSIVTCNTITILCKIYGFDILVTLSLIQLCFVIHHAGIRRPSQPIKQNNAKFGGKLPFHHILRLFLLCFKIFNFPLFYDVSFDSLTQDNMGGKLQTISPLKVRNTFTPKNPLSREDLYPSCIKREVSNFGFCYFSSFLLTWNHMGEKT